MRPKVFIPRKVYNKIMHWVNKSDLEVSGFGKVVFSDEHKYFIVKDVVLLNQEVGAAHTDIDPIALGKAMFETKDIEGDFNFWWHSHVNMDVFWSGTDKETIKEIGKQGYCLATVFNKKYEMRSAVCYTAKTNFGTSFEFVDELETEVWDYVTKEEQAIWDAEFDLKVKEEKFPLSSLAGGGKSVWDPDTKTWVDSNFEDDDNDYGYGNSRKKYEGDVEKSEGASVAEIRKNQNLRNDEQFTVVLRTKINNFKSPSNPYPTIERYAALKNGTYDKYTKQIAALFDMYCFQVASGFDGLTDEEYQDLDNIVIEFCTRYPVEMGWS